MNISRFVFGKRDRSGVFKKDKNGSVVCEEIETVTPSEILEHRKKLGMSQIQFAQHLGVSLRALQSWEQNTRTPNGTIVKKIKLLSLDPVDA